jgi:exopolysaccharide biosynthesis protein
VDGRFIGEDGKWIKDFKGGWQKIDGNWYYYTKKGKKKTGWITYKGCRYYLDENGVRLTKMQTINSKSYYFTKKGVLRSSSWVKSGSWYYYADTDGVLNKKERINARTLSTATAIEYNSSTLKVKMQKFANYGTYYWVAHVQISNASQMKAALSYGTYGGTRQKTSDAVTSNNAIIGINGSAFSYDSGKPGFDAVMLKNGKIYNKALGTSYSLMAISNDGTMFSPEQGLSANQLKKSGVRDTFNFGPILLKDGKAASLYDQGYPQVYASADMTGAYPRSAVGMVKAGEYVLLVSNAPGLTLAQMRTIFKQYGCTFAYNLDGGGSATMSYRGYVLNSPTDGTERPCGDFLLFTE